jgi:hypothetical protein
MNASPSPIITAAIWAKRRQITGCADRALAGNDRRDAFAASLDQRQRLPADAGRAAPSERSLSTIISRTLSAVKRLADAAAMRQDQVALECGVSSRRLIRTLASLPNPVLTP